jgi:hypothetical protein
MYRGRFLSNGRRNDEAISSVIGGNCGVTLAMTEVGRGQGTVTIRQGRSRARMRKRRAFSLIKPSASA